MYALSQFTNPSTFTFIERHTSAITTAAMLLPIQTSYTILDVGPGVFEPFVLGSILENWAGYSVGKIDAVESNQSVIRFLKAAILGKGVQLADIGEVSTNIGEDGSKLPNRDFSGKERVLEAVHTLEEIGVPASAWFKDNYMIFAPQVNFTIRPLGLAIAAYLDGSAAVKYDFAFFGAVLLNILKHTPIPIVLGVLQNLQLQLNPGAIVCITTTPKEFLNGSGIFLRMEEIGFRIIAIFPEKMIALGDDERSNILGDIVVLLKQSKEPITFKEEKVQKAILTAVASSSFLRSRTASSWQQTASESWHHRWITVGWVPDVGHGQELLLDLDILQSHRAAFLSPMTFGVRLAEL